MTSRDGRPWTSRPDPTSVAGTVPHPATGTPRDRRPGVPAAGRPRRTSGARPAPAGRPRSRRVGGTGSASRGPAVQPRTPHPALLEGAPLLRAGLLLALLPLLSPAPRPAAASPHAHGD